MANGLISSGKERFGRRSQTASVEADEDKVRVIKSNLVEAADLAISDDVDKGSDPYNSTGQHVIIKSKIDPQD